MSYLPPWQRKQNDQIGLLKETFFLTPLRFQPCYKKRYQGAEHVLLGQTDNIICVQPGQFTFSPGLVCLEQPLLPNHFGTNKVNR